MSPSIWLLRQTAKSLRKAHSRSLGFRRFHASAFACANSREELGDYLRTKYGVDAKLHSGIIKALESVFGSNIGVQNFDAFGKAGIDALALSVQEQIDKRKGFQKRPSIPLKVVVPHHSTSFDLEWKLGDSILDLAQDNEELMAEYMEGTCGGNMSCCTCHIYIEQPEFQALLSKPEQAELDMLVGSDDYCLSWINISTHSSLHH